MKPRRTDRARLRVGFAFGLALGVTFGSGCAGQLELPAEAYSNAQTGAGDKGQPAGAGGSWGMTGQPAAKADAGWNNPGQYGPNNTDAQSGWADAAAPVDTGWGAPDTAAGGNDPGNQPAPVDAGAPPSNPPAASACPPGVDALALLARRCGGCHGERMPAKNLDLVTAGIANRVVGAKSTCNNKPLLDASATGAAPAGHLIDKLLGPVAGCGAQMPVGTAPIVGAERDCLIEWAGQAITRAKGKMP